MRRILFAVVFALLAALAVAQEGMMETIANPFVHPAEWSVDEGQYGGTFQGYSISDFDSYNPFIVASSPDLQDGGMEMPWGGLIRRDPYALSEWIPYMAESFEVSEDQTVFTFKIREGMTFSDGEAITADDWVTTSTPTPTWARTATVRSSSRTRPSPSRRWTTTP